MCDVRVCIRVCISAEIPLPNEQARLDILKIHASGIAKTADIDYESVVKLSDGFNGADLRNVCTEAGECVVGRVTPGFTCRFRTCNESIAYVGCALMKAWWQSLVCCLAVFCDLRG